MPEPTQQPTAAEPTAPGEPRDLVQHPKFRLLGELGRGGMGVVYRAEHRLMERPVAIKVISRGLLDNPAAVERFHREVRAAAKLSHPNIVTAYDAEQAGDLHLLVMELVAGTSLADVLERRGRLPLVHACNYTRQAALGLQHAYERGMVHRDIKPQNLMLTPEGRVKILDFGLARLASEHGAGDQLTLENIMMGTPSYMAPEQGADARQADTRADVYSLGCTLYCLLTGQPPFAGASAVQILFAHKHLPAKPLHEVRPDVPAELSALVGRMLAKDPAQRYQTPAEVAQALAPFAKLARDSAMASSLTTPANDPKALSSEGATPVATGPVSPGVSTERSSRTMEPRAGASRANGRRRWPVLTAVGAGLLVVTVLMARGTGFRPKPADGTIVLTDLPADAEVLIDGNAATLKTRDGLSFEIRVAPGEPHHLQVKKDGFKVQGEEVRIEAGGRQPIAVRLEPIPPAAVNPGPGPLPGKPAAPAPRPVMPVADDPRRDPRPGFVPLFNGQDLTGWVVESGDANAWQVSDGEIVVSGPENGKFPTQSYLLTDTCYADFLLRLQFRQMGTTPASSGIALRAVPGETDRDSDPNGGNHPYHLTVWIGDTNPRNTLAMGGVWWAPNTNVQPPLLANAIPETRPVGEWNHLEVELRGQHLQVRLNGREVQNVQLNQHAPTLRYPARALGRQAGRLGLLKRAGEVRFRNLEVARLSEVKAAPDEPAVLAVMTHKPPKGAAGQFRLYQNGHTGSPYNLDHWELRGNTLILRWASPSAPGGIWVDTCTLSKDGKSYTGKNNYGAPVSGWVHGGGDLRKILRSGAAVPPQQPDGKQ